MVGNGEVLNIMRIATYNIWESDRGILQPQVEETKLFFY